MPEPDGLEPGRAMSNRVHGMVRNMERQRDGDIAKASYQLPAGLPEAVAAAAEAKGMETPSEWVTAALGEALQRQAREAR